MRTSQYLRLRNPLQLKHIKYSPELWLARPRAFLITTMSHQARASRVEVYITLNFARSTINGPAHAAVEKYQIVFLPPKSSPLKHSLYQSVALSQLKKPRLKGRDFHFPRYHPIFPFQRRRHSAEHRFMPSSRITVDGTVQAYLSPTGSGSFRLAAQE